MLIPRPAGQPLSLCVLAATMALLALAGGGCTTSSAANTGSDPRRPELAPGAAATSPMMTPQDY